MSIPKLSRAEVFMVLYNRAQPQGLGFMHYIAKQMTLEDAKGYLSVNPGPYFDYVKGRVMKIDISKESLDTMLYNRDNGPEAAEDAILEYLTAPKQSTQPV